MRRFTFTIFAWIVLFSRNANCQTGQLSGTVRDQQGAVIRGAQVTATKTDSGVERSSTTDDAGVFVLPFLSPGLYQVTVKASGFMTTVRQGITVQTGQLPQLDFVLSIGSKQESVTVQGDAPLVQTESGAVSTVIDRNFVADLPLNGRSFSALYLLIPGVQPTPSTDEGQYSVNGQRATSNQYSVDGVSANYGVYFTATLASTAAGGLAATSSTGGTNSLLSVDALQEFQVQTSSYAPEYGRTAGTQVEIVSRSGTNTFHGTAFDYLRNEALDANDWFNNYNGIARPAHRQNDFGGVLGGPVIIPKLYNGKDKTFFFFSYEGLRLTQPETLQGLVPSLSLRHEAPASMQTLLNMYPLPNGPNQGTTGLANFTKAYSTKYDVDGTSIRIDHRIADNLQFFGRYNHAPSDQLLPQALNVQGERDFSNDAVTVGVTWTITPHITNDFRANWAQTRVIGLYTATATDGAVLPSYSSLVPAGYTPNDSYWSANLTFGNTSYIVWGKNAENYQTQLNFVDNLSLVKGNHQIKLGIDYRRLSPQRLTGGYLIQYTFNNLAAVLSGTSSGATSPIRFLPHWSCLPMACLPRILGGSHRV